MAIQKHGYDDERPENDAVLAVKISSALRRRIKRAASSSNLSVDEYIEHVLEQAVQLEEDATQTLEKPLTEEQLARILRASEQISRSTQGQVLEDPVEVIRKMREERLFELPATYDAHYLALAEHKSCELWTSDTRMWRKVKAELDWVHSLSEYQTS